VIDVPRVGLMAPETGVLIVGADGVIGSAVSSELESRHIPVIRTSRRGTAGSVPFDLSMAATWDPPTLSHGAVLCAAVSDTAQCHAHPQAARGVNVDATVILARRLTMAGNRVVFLSSNMVFDGTIPRTPSDALRCPRTYYGRMKAEAEEAILSLGELATVVRLTKVIHPAMPLLVGWRAALARGQSIEPFVDVPLAPVSLRFAAAVIASATAVAQGGILQVSATNDITYADMAMHLAVSSGVSRDLVRPVAAGASCMPLEHVPAHTTLDGGGLKERLGIAAPGPWAAVADCLLMT
jgi:dTDP-4-dehydrorhamnose reductase